MIARLFLAALLAASCVAAPPLVESPPPPTATASPSPTPDPVAARILGLLELRDVAQRSGDDEAVLALLDPDAPAVFRERELALADVTRERGAGPPERAEPEYEEGPTGDLVATVLETDDQPRTRQVRYFFSSDGQMRFSEPAEEDLGPERVRTTDRLEIRYRDIDAAQALAVERLAQEGLQAMLARLGEDYRPGERISITLAPTAVEDLPAVASGFVRDGRITLLSSQSMLVAEGPAAEWSRTVIAHEIAHVMLLPRGRGPFFLLEGIPLWLTDDRRPDELARAIAADALWDLPHLIEGPRSLAEFFSGYAQASSLTRYLAETYGEAAVMAAWESGRSMDFAEAFRSAFGLSADEAHAAWRARLGARAPVGARIMSGTVVLHWPDASLFPG